MSEISLEQRISNLEDIEAIKVLKSRYFRACDSKDIEAMRDCFYEGVVDLDYGRIGTFTKRDDLIEVFKSLAVNEHIVEMHHGQNPEVILTGDGQANGIFGLYYLLINTRDNTLTQLGANYFDRFVKYKGLWKIQASRCDVGSTLLLDTSADSVTVLFAGRQAPADLDDPSQQA